MDLGIFSETVIAGNKLSWLYSTHGLDTAVPVTLDGSAFTGTFTDGRVPSGMPLGKITSGGLYAPYDNAASDGTQTLVGFLIADTQVIGRGGTTNDVQGAMLLHGIIREANLPAAWTGMGGTDKTAGKTDVAGRIIFV